MGWTTIICKLDLFAFFPQPSGTLLKFYIPAKDIKDVTESGKPAAKATGATYLKNEGDIAVFLLDSGEYDFTSSSVPPAK